MSGRGCISAGLLMMVAGCLEGAAHGLERIAEGHEHNHAVVALVSCARDWANAPEAASFPLYVQRARVLAEDVDNIAAAASHREHLAIMHEAIRRCMVHEESREVQDAQAVSVHVRTPVQLLCRAKREMVGRYLATAMRVRQGLIPPVRPESPI